MSASSVVVLPHTPASVAAARQRLCAELLARGVPEPTVSDAALVVSELLSNALRHARPLPGDAVEVGWRLYDDFVEVAVSDGGSVLRPRLSHPPLSALGGRGLGIVDHLATRWGVRHEDGTTTVWAHLRAERHLNGRRCDDCGERAQEPVR